jgi:general secretion pathway protein A
MYAKFFGLRQEPFSIAPDPRYLFMSERHREALAHLLYGLRGGGGFVLLTGEIGAGKTTVCRCFLEQIPKRCNVAYIFNPKLTVMELLKTVCEEFRIPLDPGRARSDTVKEYLDPINEFLLKTHAVGQNNVLIIEEAQNLSSDVLEQLRLLTNLETSERKLLQIILIGQPELREMLARPELEQLAQRVIARYHLKALTEAETSQYIRHRLGVAGFSGAVPFDRSARRRIHALSRGVPRRINLLCDRVLLGAYGEGRSRVDAAMVDKGAAEVFGDGEHLPSQASRFSRQTVWATAAGGVLAGVALFGVVSWARDGASKSAADVVAAAKAATPAASSALLPASSVTAAASAAPPVPATGYPDLTQHDEAQAWRELASRWKVSLPEGDPCGGSPSREVQCFKSEDGGLPLIRQLNRPGVLTLYDENGRAAYAVLVGLTGDVAQLRSGGTTRSVSLATLARNWRGEFATLWRVPPAYTGKVVNGQGGATVDWLAVHLARANGEAAPGGPRRFDSALQQQVATFQVAHGLKPDGRVGPLTLMQLNRAAGVEEPRLPTVVASN